MPKEGAAVELRCQSKQKFKVSVESRAEQVPTERWPSSSSGFSGAGRWWVGRVFCYFKSAGRLNGKREAFSESRVKRRPARHGSAEQRKDNTGSSSVRVERWTLTGPRVRLLRLPRLVRKSLCLINRPFSDSLTCFQKTNSQMVQRVKVRAVVGIYTSIRNRLQDRTSTLSLFLSADHRRAANGLEYI